MLILTEAMMKAIKYGKFIYENNSAGGNCHVVLDDYNLEDYFIEGCIDYCKENPSLFEERQLLKLFLKMGPKERFICAELIHGRVPTEQDYKDFMSERAEE